MTLSRLRFRLSDLIAATALVAGILASAIYLPSTYETDGAVAPVWIGLLLVVVWVVGGICFCFRRLRWPALVITLLICAAFSWRQARLVHRLNLLKVEVPRIVAYIEKFKNENSGECPDDLSGYVFERPELRPYIEYSPPTLYHPRKPASPYAIRFHPVREYDVAHWYLAPGRYWYDDD